MDNKPVRKEGSEILEGGVKIQNIVINPVHRTKADILNWRNAHQYAEAINGSRIALYDLYDDALLDAFLNRMVQNRILGVTKNKIIYVDKNQCAIDIPKNPIKLYEFQRLREAIQNSRAWGIGVFELINDNGSFRFFDVPKKHILPKEGKILYDQYGVEGIMYRNEPYNKTVIQIGKHDDLGYLLVAVPYALYKRGDIADWANYAQIFGMPFREARYDGFNEVVRLQLEQALEAAAAAAWIVLPKDAEFTMHEAKSVSGSSELYNTFRKAMNEEIMVAILGATETTTTSSSSGYAQSKTHKKAVNELQHDDMQHELATLNSIVLPVFIQIGLLPPGGKLIYENPIDLEAAVQKLGIIQSMKEMDFPVSDDDVYRISGLRKPRDYKEAKLKLINELKRGKDTNAIASQNPGKFSKDILSVIKKMMGR